MAIVAAIALGVGIAFLPHSSGVDKQPEPEEQTSSLHDKVHRAVDIITKGEGAPMEGIKLLKEVLEEDPQNEEALYYLGNFSIQSGQFDKAIGRFQSLVEINPSNEEARYLLAYSFLMNGDSVEAKKNYQVVFESAQSAELRGLAEKEINNLKNI